MISEVNECVGLSPHSVPTTRFFEKAPLVTEFKNVPEHHGHYGPGLTEEATKALRTGWRVGLRAHGGWG